MNRRHLCQSALTTCLSTPAWLQAATPKPSVNKHAADQSASQKAASEKSEPDNPSADKVITLSGLTLEGKPYDLKQDQGKVVMLFFWSTECAVCRNKMPELRLNFSGWRSKGFQLVAISTDKTLAAVRDYQNVVDSTTKVTQRFPTLWRGAPEHVDNLERVIQSPTTFVLNREHKLIKQVRGRMAPELWDDVADLVSG
jgi:peroxiredoxin